SRAGAAGWFWALSLANDGTSFLAVLCWLKMAMKLLPRTGLDNGGGIPSLARGRRRVAVTRLTKSAFGQGVAVASADLTRRWRKRPQPGFAGPGGPTGAGMAARAPAGAAARWPT